MKKIICDHCNSEVPKNDINTARSEYIHKKTRKKFSVIFYFCGNCAVEVMKNPSVMIESQAFNLRFEKRIADLSKEQAHERIKKQNNS